jgi:formylglycine-generating enzyme required for sulfatase activity
MTSGINTATISGTGTSTSVLIAAGSFSMGGAIYDDPSAALPVHDVYVSAFYMDKNLVTKALWDEVRAWGLNNGYTDLPGGDGKASNHPVQKISWYAMVKWCNARSQKEGRTPCYTVSGAAYTTGDNRGVVCSMSANGYRLPTEAEWEKAARGGLVWNRFPWGNTISESLANYNGSTSSYSYDSGPDGYNQDYYSGVTPYTSPAGSFAANGYGLYDMAGNVWQWCNDWIGNYGSAAVSDPTGPSSGSNRVLRGGSWNYDAGHCRVSFRFDSNPANGKNYYGFRCVRR